LDKEFTVTAPGHEIVRAQAERGFWNTECYLRIPEKEFAKMAPGVSYELTPRNEQSIHWEIHKGIRIVKPLSDPKSDTQGQRPENDQKKAAVLDQRSADVPVSVTVPLVVAPITKVYWYFSEERPKWIRENEVQRNGDGHLLMHVEVRRDDMDPLWRKLDKEFVLTARGHAVVRAQADRGFWANECYLRIPAAEYAKMEADVDYELTPLKTNSLPQWWIEKSIRVVKPVELPKESRS
jgi:hypothetical protein